MSPEEIKERIKSIITNNIRAEEDPEAEAALKKDLHDVLIAKMRERVLGKQTPVATEEDDDTEDADDDEDTEDEENKE